MYYFLYCKLKNMKKQGEFIRWGNLSPQKHKIPKNPNDRSYHCPPMEKGFYAFPRGFIEIFLIGGAGSGSLQNGRYSKFKDKNGKPYKVKGSEFDKFKKRFPKRISQRLRISFTWESWYEKHEHDDLDYEDYEKEAEAGIWDVWIENEPNHFKYGGLIWHHLFNSDAPQLDKEYPNYIKIINSWVLTDMPTYLRILDHWYGKEKWQGSFKDYYDNEPGIRKHRKKSPYFNYGGARYCYSKDHFEVYIESIQNE